MKMFIGRVPHGTTVEDLNRHFSQYGQLTDTYIPTPFRNYAFITFASSEDAKNCMVDTHMLNVSDESELITLGFFFLSRSALSFVGAIKTLCFKWEDT